LLAAASAAILIDFATGRRVVMTLTPPDDFIKEELLYDTGFQRVPASVPL
jgi:hypothetical protein